MVCRGPFVDAVSTFKIVTLINSLKNYLTAVQLNRYELYLEKRNFCCSCQESNQDLSSAQTAVWSLYGLRCCDSH